MTRRVLQAANVGPNGNSLYVLRVVDDSIQEVVEVEVVDVRGTVVWPAGRYFTESGARATANAIYSAFRKNDGDLAAVLKGIS